VGRTIELDIPPRNGYLALVRRVVATAARLDGTLVDRRIDDLSLAVSEACANAIDGQRSAGSPEPISVVLELDGSGVVVTVTDHGGGFSPDEVDPIPDADDPGRLRHERGLGLPLMRSLAESVHFTATEGGTAVRLEVRREEA
jgi:anti-sigma regulatory factor (Ser/Thr protein kinase)